VALTGNELRPAELRKRHSKALESHTLLVGNEVIQGPFDINPLNHDRRQPSRSFNFCKTIVTPWPMQL
jgi:hypothetical protein